VLFIGACALVFALLGMIDRWLVFGFKIGGTVIGVNVIGAALYRARKSQAIAAVESGTGGGPGVGSAP
jgi:hypothetical protein